MDACPSDTQLLEHVDDESMPGALAEHLRSCAECAWIVEQMRAASGIGDSGRVRHDRAPVSIPPKLGRYRVLRMLGRGGMGVVFLAYDPDLDRSIALKVLHPGRAAASASDRRDLLLAEARAAAQLSHPNVITVYDVALAGEQVYVAMELAQESLGHWRDRVRPSWRQIVALLADAADGLFAAHTAGIVHRDIKPGNLLISSSGQIKVSDFGLAIRHTPGEVGVVPAGGTPPYMPPEGRLTPASDQYSLCVTLHEAIHGQRPYPGVAGFARVPRSLRRVIARGLSPRADDRFPTTHQLAVALRQCLTQRGRRARHAAGAAVAASVALAAVLLRPASVATCASPAAELARAWPQAAREQLVRAASGDPARRWVVGALTAFGDDWSRHHVDICRDTHIRGRYTAAVLDRRMACMDRELERFAALTRLLGQNTDRLEQAMSAVDALDPRRCDDVSALARELQPRDPAQLAALGSFHRAESELVARLDLGEAAGAESKLLELLAVTVRIHAPQTWGRYHVAAIRLHRELDRTAAAEDSLNQAIWAAKSARDDRTELRASVEAVELYADSDPVRAAWWARYARSIATSADDARTLAQVAELDGIIAHKAGRVDEAARAFGDALRLRHSVHSADHPTVAIAEQNLAVSLAALGRTREAEDHFAEAIRVKSALFGPDHINVVGALSGLGNLLTNQGRYREARALLVRVLDITRASQAASHPRVIAAQVNLANTERHLGNLDRAAELYRASLAVVRPGDRVVAVALRGLSEIEAAQGHRDDARTTALSAVSAAEASYGPEHPTTASFVLAYGELLRDQGRYREALEQFDRARRMWQKAGPDHQPKIGMVLCAAGIAHRLGGDVARAIDSLERSAAVTGQSEPDLANAEFELALALWEAGRDRDRALALARSAQRRLRSFPDLVARAEAIGEWLRKSQSRAVGRSPG